MPECSPQAAMFAQLCAEDPEFRRLAQKHRSLDQQIQAYDRIYYLTATQERQRKVLQKQKLLLKDQMQIRMVQSTTVGHRNGH